MLGNVLRGLEHVLARPVLDLQDYLLHKAFYADLRLATEKRAFNHTSPSTGLTTQQHIRKQDRGP